MSVSIFSYRDEVSIGLLVDANLISDPRLIVHHLRLEVAAVGRLHHP